MLQDEKLKVNPSAIEKYSFVYINCFVRAIAMEVERLRPDCSEYFVFFNSIFRSYNNMAINYDYRPSKIRGHLVNPDVEEELKIINYILQNCFGLKLKGQSTDSKKNLYELIKESVLGNQSVILPVNPSILYFCDYYKEKNWIHWLYCNGFNDEKELILVEDHVQFGMENTKYRPFKYSKEQVNLLHNSYNSVWEKEAVPSLYKCFVIEEEKEGIVNDSKSFLREVKNYLYPYVKGERALIHIEEAAFLEKDYDNIFSFKHLKTLYNEIISNEIEKNTADIASIDKLTNLNEEIKKKWDHLSKNAKIAELRKRHLDATTFDELKASIRKMEKEYINGIYSLIKL